MADIGQEFRLGTGSLLRRKAGTTLVRVVMDVQGHAQKLVVIADQLHADRHEPVVDLAIEFHQAIYALTEQYPVSPVEASPTGSMAGRKISGLRIFPIQYIPAERKVLFNREITFTVEFGDAEFEGRCPAETPAVRNLRNGIVAGLVENGGDLEHDFPSGVGTLDPAVTGVLPVLLDRSTPAAVLLLGCDKTYEGEMRLHGDVSAARLEEALGRLLAHTGDRLQVEAVVPVAESEKGSASTHQALDDGQAVLGG